MKGSEHGFSNAGTEQFTKRNEASRLILNLRNCGPSTCSSELTSQLSKANIQRAKSKLGNSASQDFDILLYNYRLSFAEICGDDESAQKLRREMPNILAREIP